MSRESAAEMWDARRRVFRGCCLAWTGLVMLGCSPPAAPTPPAVRDDDVARTRIERGPVTVTVEARPKKLRLSDEPTLTIRVHHADGVEVEKPPFGEAVGDFVIRDFREPLPRREGNQQSWEVIYTLEPTRTGKLQIDPIEINFTDRRVGGDGQSHTLETEALTLEVSSVVPTDIPSLDDLAPPVGPMPLPRPRRGRWLYMAAALGGLALLAGLWYVRRRRHGVESVQLSPAELAYLELQQLLQSELSQRDVKLFYVNLTGIVRRYIERVTGVHAAEQTTEEFLREITVRHEMFPATERDKLKSFLESADLVKYAAHEPRQQDIVEAFERAKAFIGLGAQGETGP